MEFHETRAGQKFYNADIPKIKDNIEDLSYAINRLCTILDPSNYVEEIIPSEKLKEMLARGANFKAVLNEDFVIVRWQK